MTNNKPKDKILNPIMKGISKKDFQNNNEKKRKEKTRQDFFITFRILSS